MPPYPGFIGGSYVAQSPVAHGARLVNWYLERPEVEGAQPLEAYPTPGYETVATAVTAPGRGSFACQGRAFLVLGDKLCELSSIYGLTVLGTVATDANPASMAWNGEGGGQLAVASGDALYCLDLVTGVFSTVTMPGGCTMVSALDGYIFAFDAATSTVYISDLLDATTFDPTQYVQRSIASDPWVSMAVVERYLWLLGEETSEAWYDAGGFPIPIEPHSSGLMQHGCLAPWSPKVVGGVLRFLGRTAHGSGNVIALAGFTPEVISSFAIHAELDRHETVSDAVGDVYEDLGHTFYLLSLPSAEITLAYDAATNLNLPPAMRWAERGTWVSEENRYVALRAVHHLYAFGVHLALDSESGAIFRQSSDLGYDVGGRPLRRMRRAPFLWGDGRRQHVPVFEVFMEPGLGALSGQGDEPTVALRISRDGGKTWGAERTRSLGARGKYGTRMRWLQCGAGRRWMPEIVVSDPTPMRLLGASIQGVS